MYNVQYKAYAILYIMLLLVRPTFAPAQNLVEYAPMQNTALLVDFKNQSAERFVALSEQFEVEHNAPETRTARKRREAFFLQNNYVVQDLFKSGAVLFDAECSAYLKSIAAKVLQKDTVLLRVAQFYLVRSPAVNAFATQDGSVFIYMGLMAALHTEAELAFVISHELSHVRQQHALNLFIKTAEIAAKQRENARKTFKNSNIDVLKRLNSYSQQNELAADAYGFEQYFAASGYTHAAPETLLDVLRYAYLPFENLPFEKAFLEDERLIFPENYEINMLRKIGKGTENAANEQFSHPSIATRRAQFKQLIAASKTFSGVDAVTSTMDFLVSETLFQKWKTACRFELPMLFLHYNDFQEAIYTSYLLLHTQPNDLYLKKCIAKSLYGFAKFRNDTTETCNAEMINHKDIEGESQQLYHFLEQLDGLELTVLALNYTQNLCKQYNDSELKLLQKDLIAELTRYYFKDIFTIKTFVHENPDIYFTKALIRWTEEPKFVALYQTQLLKDKRFCSQNLLYTPKKDDVLRLGIPKIIIANNSFKSVDTRRAKNAVEYDASLLGAQRFEKNVATNAQKAGLDFILLPTEPTKNTLAIRKLYNHRILLNDWFAEQLSYNNMAFEGYQNDRIRAIADEMDCDYFLWTGVIQVRRPKDGVAIAVSTVMGIGIYPLLPFAAYSIAKADYDLLIYGILYNINTQESQVIKYEMVDGNVPNAVINSHLYDMFRQIYSK